MEENVFEIIDKSERKIKLTKKQWSHIASPSSPHAYMASSLEDVKQTLIHPDKIINSVYDDFKVNYYKYYKDRKESLRVVVKYLNGDRFVITAYFVRNIVK